MKQVLELEKWFSQHCDGTWEHQHGVLLETIDNPGWRLHVDIPATHPAADFAPIKVERSESDWVSCSFRDGAFEGFGGPCNLSELLEIFLRWTRGDGRGTSD